jgi:DNA-binding transcriptional ArsR family regulator
MKTTSSQELGEHVGISAAQIRKDISQFGEFGKQGTGYSIQFLLDKLREICVCRFAEALDVAQPKISRHLAVLRESGVVISRRLGTLILYRFDPALAGWAMRVIAMMTEGAKLEPYHEGDRGRLAHAKLCGRVGVP